MQFKVLFNSNAVGAILEFASGANPPGHHYWVKQESDLTCGPSYALGSPVCITYSVDTFYFVFCEPGNNPNQYRVESIAGFAQSAPEVTVNGCTADLTVTGVFDESSIVWSHPNPLYESFLTCLTGCATTTVVIPDIPGLPASITYDVCADVSSVCAGSFPPICTTATVLLLTPPEITIPDYTFCPEDLYEVDVTPIGVGSYEYIFYNGPNGTGGVVCAQSASELCTYPSIGTKSVVVVDLGLVSFGTCAFDTVDFCD